MSRSAPPLPSPPRGAALGLWGGLAAALLAAVAAPGCTVASTFLADRCDVNVLEVAPTEAAPGAEVAIIGGPLTRDWDTLVLVSGVSATIAGLDREGCTECDSCRNAQGCNECDDCDECDATCAALCVESVRFVVPELPPGPAELRLINGHGSSLAAALLILEPATDTGGADTGAADTGATDTGAADTGGPTPPPPTALAECW